MLQQWAKLTTSVYMYWQYNLDMSDFSYLCKMKQKNGISHLVSELGVPWTCP